MSFHRWMGTDVAEHESCLTCGGVWEYSETDRYHHAMDGSNAVPCTADTSQVHGYPGEQWCDTCDAPNVEPFCPHVHPDCNCLFCDS